MSFEDKFGDKVEQDSPDAKNRCQANVHNGQCPYPAQAGGVYCLRHGGGEKKKIEAEGIRNYRLTRYQARLIELADSPHAKSLREEIGILRMTLEAVMESCKEQMDLVIYSSKIASLVTSIERVVGTCQKIEEKTGALLDKTAALNFAAQLTSIVMKYVQEPELLDKISTEMLFALGSITNPVIDPYTQ